MSTHRPRKSRGGCVSDLCFRGLRGLRDRKKVTVKTHNVLEEILFHTAPTFEGLEVTRRLCAFALPQLGFE